MAVPGQSAANRRAPQGRTCAGVIAERSRRPGERTLVAIFADHFAAERTSIQIATGSADAVHGPQHMLA